MLHQVKANHDLHHHRRRHHQTSRRYMKDVHYLLANLIRTRDTDKQNLNGLWKTGFQKQNVKYGGFSKFHPNNVDYVIQTPLIPQHNFYFIKIFHSKKLQTIFHVVSLVYKTAKKSHVHRAQKVCQFKLYVI